MSHPAIFAVDIEFVDALFHDYGKARGDESLESFKVPPLADNR
jgi:hypothetical protein